MSIQNAQKIIVIFFATNSLFSDLLIQTIVTGNYQFLCQIQKANTLSLIIKLYFFLNTIQQHTKQMKCDCQSIIINKTTLIIVKIQVHSPAVGRTVQLMICLDSFLVPNAECRTVRPRSCQCPPAVAVRTIRTIGRYHPLQLRHTSVPSVIVAVFVYYFKKKNDLAVRFGALLCCIECPGFVC